MTRVPIALSALLALAACSTGSGGSSGAATNGTTSGSATNGTGGPYTFVAADDSDAGMGGLPIALAVGPNDRVGVAYFRPTGSFSLPLGDAGQRENYGVMYVELQNQAIKIPPSQIAVVQVQDGLTVNFDQKGEAVVGFVGGNAYFYDGGIPPDAGPDTTGSLFWIQSQAALAYQEPDGGWDLQVCMVDSTAGPANFTWTVNGSDGPDPLAMQLINEGNVVGLWPTLAFDGGTTIMAFRDVHFGQFPVQDWAASDLKLCQGSPNNWTSWSAPMTIDATGGHKDTGYATHNTMIFGKNGALAILGDQDINGQGQVDSEGANAAFVQQNLGSWTSSTSDWSLPINPFNPKNNISETLTHTQTGPALAYSSSFGYQAVAVDTSPPTGGASALYYTTSSDGVTWTPRYTLYSNGSGGFYPAIADDPLTGDPYVVYTHCSGEPGILPSPGACPKPELDLAIISTNAPSLTDSVTTISTDPVFMPKIAFLSTDKFVVAYRNLDTGSLYVAFQN